jgi:hypothetical protein
MSDDDTSSIKADILEFVLESVPTAQGRVATNGTADLREFADAHGYETAYIRSVVQEIGADPDVTGVLAPPAIDWGVSPLCVWYYDAEAVEDAIAFYRSKA